MKNNWRLIIGVLICLVMTVTCYFWANALIDSLYSFRSPLAQNPPLPGKAPGAPLTRRVVVVLIDALRADTSANPQVMPFLNQLRQMGASAVMHSRPPSYSQTGYTMIFSGAWADVADAPLINLDDNLLRAWTQDNLFSAAHRAGLKTAVSGFYWFGAQIPHQDVDASFYTRGEDAAADLDVIKAAMPMLQDPSYNLVLIHIDQVDYVGHHLGGPRNPAWNAAATQADTYLRQIVSTLDLSQDTVLVISDHGQLDRGGHGGQEPILLLEPFVLTGKGVRPGQYPDIQMIDVAPTLASLLGTNIPASNQGNVQFEMLNMPEDQIAVTRASQLDQTQKLVTAYQQAIGYTGQPDSGIDYMELRPTLENARNARQSAEQTPRALFSLVLLLLPAIFMFINRSRELLWKFAGVGLFLVLFNIRYIYISERTYSLTTVANAGDIIGYTAVTAGLAFVIVWLLLSWQRGVFRQSPGQAAMHTLSFTLVSLYVLAFCILAGFTLNGPTVTWTLPEYNALFLGFLAMIQVIIVSAAGLLLTGLVSLILFAKQKIAS